MNFDQDFIVPGRRFFYFFEAEEHPGAVFCVYNRFHEFSSNLHLKG